MQASKALHIIDTKLMPAPCMTVKPSSMAIGRKACSCTAAAGMKGDDVVYPFKKVAVQRDMGRDANAWGISANLAPDMQSLEK